MRWVEVDRESRRNLNDGVDNDVKWWSPVVIKILLSIELRGCRVS